MGDVKTQYSQAPVQHATLQGNLQAPMQQLQPFPLQAMPQDQLQTLSSLQQDQQYFVTIPSHLTASAVPQNVQLFTAHEGKKSGSGKKRGHDGDGEGQPVKRHRAKKAPGAPKRPKSAYMFFLAKFRENWKKEHPESKKVADVATAAGEVWRTMSEEEKKSYEEKSTNAKQAYADAMKEYEKEHPRPARKQKKERDPDELRRPRSAYIHFLSDFREAYKKDHPGVSISVISRAAGDKWKLLSSEERDPYEQLSQYDKDEYARKKKEIPKATPVVAFPMQASMVARGATVEQHALPGLVSLSTTGGVCVGQSVLQHPVPFATGQAGVPVQFSLHQMLSSQGFPAASISDNVVGQVQLQVQQPHLGLHGQSHLPAANPQMSIQYLQMPGMPATSHLRTEALHGPSAILNSQPASLAVQPTAPMGIPLSTAEFTVPQLASAPTSVTLQFMEDAVQQAIPFHQHNVAIPESAAPSLLPVVGGVAVKSEALTYESGAHVASAVQQVTLPTVAVSAVGPQELVGVSTAFGASPSSMAEAHQPVSLAVVAPAVDQVQSPKNLVACNAADVDVHFNPPSLVAAVTQELLEPDVAGGGSHIAELEPGNNNEKVESISTVLSVQEVSHSEAAVDGTLASMETPLAKGDAGDNGGLIAEAGAASAAVPVVQGVVVAEPMTVPARPLVVEVAAAEPAGGLIEQVAALAPTLGGNQEEQEQALGSQSMEMGEVHKEDGSESAQAPTTVDMVLDGSQVEPDGTGAAVGQAQESAEDAKQQQLANEQTKEAADVDHGQWEAGTSLQAQKLGTEQVEVFETPLQPEDAPGQVEDTGPPAEVAVAGNISEQGVAQPADKVANSKPLEVAESKAAPDAIEPMEIEGVEVQGQQDENEPEGASSADRQAADVGEGAGVGEPVESAVTVAVQGQQKKNEPEGTITASSNLLEVVGVVAANEGSEPMEGAERATVQGENE